MADGVLFGMMVLAFATFVTAHLVLVTALTFAHRPRWRGLAALFLPPLAPMWGWQVGRKWSAGIWAAAIAIYAIARLVGWLALGR